MSRAEATPEVFIEALMKQFGSVGEWNGYTRLKWILNSRESTQVTEEEIVLYAVREKNKTL